ncbi:DUF2252 family protein [Paenibacillus sp. XY044]|uniref:DUF2252 family protein n=1 Tax=Paenibacillus sp. XY044 TaxID=2026089 RepID=UPI000B97FB61|nr:DUF2252 family protein [Paenibacillus sp. XY044]OZB96639.1 hypothetical protein CJP46_12275 [Paenibacillus sp. XY044]
MSYFSLKHSRIKKVMLAAMAALMVYPAASGAGGGGRVAHAEESGTAQIGSNANSVNAPSTNGLTGDTASSQAPTTPTGDAADSEVPTTPTVDPNGSQTPTTTTGDTADSQAPTTPEVDTDSSQEPSDGGLSQSPDGAEGTAPADVSTGQEQAELAAAKEAAIGGADKPVVISKIFGGGSQNEDALYKYDFVELYNSADTDVNLEGWSLQYAASSAKTDSPSWQVTPLHGTIPAKGYYLIQEAGKAELQGPDLPVPDDTGIIDMDNKDGKVALVADTAELTVLNPSSPAVTSVVDFVGYGAAPSYEGSGAASTPSAQKTLVRKAEDPVLGTGVPSVNGSDAELYGNGWNTHDNKSDFDIATLGTFAPHNAADLTALSARADADKHIVRMASKRDISRADAQFAVNVITGTLKSGELDSDDYVMSGLPAGLSVTHAEADPQSHQVTFTIGGTAQEDVNSSVELNIVIRKTAVTGGAYDDSRTVTGITLENHTLQITGDVVSNMLSMTAPSTAAGSFAIRIRSGAVQEGPLQDTDYAVTGLPEGLQVQAAGDTASNQIVFTVSGTAVEPVIEPVQLTVVLKASAVTTVGALDSDPFTGIVLDRYKTPVQAGEQRRAELANRIKESNAYYNDPETKAYKYGTDGMAASDAAFYRGAPYLMYEDLGKVIQIPEGWKKLQNVKTWIGGDAHIANVGFYDDKNGSIIFDLNDFDGSYIAPFYLDLLRMTSSLYLTRDSEKLALSDDEIRSMAADMLEEYMQTLQSLIGNDSKNTAASKLDMDHVSDGFTKTIMTKLAKKTQLDLLIKWTVPTADGKHSTGVLNVAGKPDKYRKASDSERSEVEQNWQKYVDTLEPDFVQSKLADNPDYFKIKDVAVRIYQGLGSIGSQRYNVLIEGPTPSHDDDILLDVKQSFKPDMFENAEEAQVDPYDAYPGGDGAKVKTAYAKLSLDSEPFLGYFNSSNKFFFVHKISPYKGDYEDASGGTFKTKENLADYVGYTAKAYAYAHARSSEYPDDTFETSVISQVYDGGNWTSFETTLLNLGEDYYRQVASDYELMKSDLLGGKLIDVAALGELALKGASLSPAFDGDKLDYTAVVDHSVASVELTATALDSKASIIINGGLYSAGAPKTISLKPGINQVDVIVTAQDGLTSKTYTILIQRQESGGSDGGGNGNGSSGGGTSGSGGNSANGGSSGSNGTGTSTTPTARDNTLVINAAQFQQALSDAQSDSVNQQLEFDLKGHGEQEVLLQLPFDGLRSAVKMHPNMVIAFNTDNVSYRLPMQAIDFEGLAKGLNGGQTGAVTFNIRIEPNLTSEWQTKLGAAQLEPVTSPFKVELFAEASGKQEEIHQDGYAALTLPYEANRSGSEPLVVNIHPDGTISVVPAVFKDGKALVHSLVTGTYAVVYAKPLTFADLPGHWAKSDIELLAGKRIVQGITAQAFSPDREMSRAELTALFSKAFALPEDPASAGFSDVPAGAWYSGAVQAASKAGIVAGFPGGDFKPSEAVTREQMAVMMAKAAELAGTPLQAPAAGRTASAAFKDAGRVSGYARAAIEACLSAGIIQGNPDGSLSPQAPVTRAQTAVMVKRLLQVVGFLN